MKRPLYITAGVLVAVVLTVLVLFAVYGTKLPYMAHQQCVRITHNVPFCSAVIPLP